MTTATITTAVKTRRAKIAIIAIISPGIACGNWRFSFGSSVTIVVDVVVEDSSGTMMPNSTKIPASLRDRNTRSLRVGVSSDMLKMTTWFSSTLRSCAINLTKASCSVVPNCSTVIPASLQVASTSALPDDPWFPETIVKYSTNSMLETWARLDPCDCNSIKNSSVSTNSESTFIYSSARTKSGSVVSLIIKSVVREVNFVDSADVGTLEVVTCGVVT